MIQRLIYFLFDVDVDQDLSWGFGQNTYTGLSMWLCGFLTA